MDGGVGEPFGLRASYEFLAVSRKLEATNCKLLMRISGVAILPSSGVILNKWTVAIFKKLIIT